MRLLLATCLLLIFASPALAADSYYIGARAGANVLASPNKSADVITHLPRKTNIRILQSRRNWKKIESMDADKTVGWVPEGAIRKRYQASTRSKSTSFLSSFASYFRTPEPTQKTAVLGVRGLDDGGSGSAESSTNAQAESMVKWMDTLNVSHADVAAFIEEGDLNP